MSLKQWIVKEIILCFLILSVATQDASSKNKNSDENRPYEFGFTIEGQQHRHEAKDEKGIVTGEFGFITADGVYHVTVYATDENGRFKILSMRSIKVSPPLDGSPDPSSIPIQASLSDLQKSGAPSNKPSTETPRFGVTLSTTASVPHDRSSIPIKATVSSYNPPSEVTTMKQFTTLKPLPVASCGSCAIPSTTEAPPGSKPNKFIFQTPEFQDSPAPQPIPPKLTPASYPEVQPQVPPTIDVSGLDKITSSHYFTMDQKTPSQTPSKLPNDYPNAPQKPAQELLGPFSSPRPADYNYTYNYTQYSDYNYTLNDNPPTLNILDAPKQTQELKRPTKPYSSPVPQMPPTLTQGIPTSRKLDIPIQSNPIGQIPNVLDDQGVVSMPTPNDYGVPPIPSDLLIPKADKPTDLLIPDAEKPLTKPMKPSIPEGLSFPGLIHPPKSKSIEGEKPEIDGTLPPGVTVDDMRELLYKFNYSVGFHGHYEMGYRNGVKIGGYYVNGRDGYSRIVEYIADERGYHPKVYYVYLGLDSPDIPKEETEKEYGLKGQVFEWYSIS